MSQNLKLLAGTLNRVCYPPLPQTLYNEMFELGAALLGDITGIIISDAAPGVNDRDKAWIKTSGGAPTWPAPFIFYNGMWVTPHPLPASGSLRQLWVGATVDLTTFDGGSAGTVGQASGPMWEVDTDLAGRFLMAPGTIPGTSPARSVAVTGTADDASGVGEYIHTIAREQLPNESLHLFSNEVKGEPVEAPGADDTVVRYSNPDSEAQSYRLNKGTASIPTVGKTEPLGDGDSYVQAPPFYGIYVIKRTARIYVVG